VANIREEFYKLGAFPAALPTAPKQLTQNTHGLETINHWTLFSLTALTTEDSDVTSFTAIVFHDHIVRMTTSSHLLVVFRIHRLAGFCSVLKGNL